MPAGRVTTDSQAEASGDYSSRDGGRPLASDLVLTELAGRYWTTARCVRLEIEVAGEVERTTTRTGWDGVAVQAIERPEGEVAPVGELADALRGIGA